MLRAVEWHSRSGYLLFNCCRALKTKSYLWLHLKSELNEGIYSLLWRYPAFKIFSPFFSCNKPTPAMQRTELLVPDWHIALPFLLYSEQLHFAAGTWKEHCLLGGCLGWLENTCLDESPGNRAGERRLETLSCRSVTGKRRKQAQSYCVQDL